MHFNRIFRILIVFIIILASITSGLGLFLNTGGQPFYFENQYGDIIKIYGNGIYKNDSYFIAPIFKGTDFTILFLAIPLLIFNLVMDKKNNSLKTKLFLISLVSFFLYYSISISMGVKYNILHLIYIVLFSSSFFAFLTGFLLVKNYSIVSSVKICTNGIKIFLTLCGISLFIAWLPDIIVSLINNKSLKLIEVYTTQITYVLDIGIISPLIFMCLYNLCKNNNIGYILLGIILNMLSMVGIMVIIQTIFQHRAGIELPVEAAVTKVGIFVLLAIVAVYYSIKLFKNIKSNGTST